MTRHARQMMVEGVGPEGQARLSAAHVLVVGAGGLGCPVLQYLAGAGVGRITIIDPDHVEESNLHRQPLYRMSDLGRAKAEAAKDHLRAAHPEVEINTVIGALHPAMTDEVVAPTDLVIDAADGFAVSYMLSDACLRTRTPLISASALGETGYVGGFCGGAPSLRAVFPDPPGNAATCATAGVLGPVVGTIGALQAQMALRVLLRSGPSPLGRMMTLDLCNLQSGGFSFLGTPEPEACYPFVSVADLTETDHVIELRSAEEAPALPAPHAERWAPEALAAFRPDPERRVILCCATGLRAWRAAVRLEGHHPGEVALLAARACA